jgi:hypothetical protein
MLKTWSCSPLGKEHVLPDVVQDAVKRMLRNRREEIEWRHRASDVHALCDAPVEHRTRKALQRHQRLDAFAIARPEERHKLLLQRHIKAVAPTAARPFLPPARLPVMAALVFG